MKKNKVSCPGDIRCSELAKEFRRGAESRFKVPPLPPYFVQSVINERLYAPSLQVLLN